ncbi:MAG TPA: response regulator, partial [Fibrobacteria bacterium]|nr:response regulator [Fibrobacteria bacterium]
MDIQGSVVMVVDDEDLVREMARLALEAEGLVVLTARNGVEALLLAERHGGPIHLLLTDLSMPPYMDGLELARSLRCARPGLQVLFLSARGHEVPMPIDPDSGAALVAKPFTSETLVERVRAALESLDVET